MAVRTLLLLAVCLAAVAGSLGDQCAQVLSTQSANVSFEKSEGFQTCVLAQDRVVASRGPSRGTLA